MKQKFREHYSQSFNLDLNTLPTRATDRASQFVLFFSFLFGFLFFILGCTLLNMTTLTGSTDLDQYLSKSAIKVHSLISTDTFGLITFVLGACIVLVSCFHDIRFKQISFDGQTITVKDFPLFGKPHSFSAPISEFSGVRLRLKFFQYGIFSRNKYIVELYHTDPTKIVPLYITTRPKSIRSIWKNYALKLNLPPIHISERGMVSHNANDMDRSFVDVVKKWNLPKNFLLGKKHSQHFVCKQKQDRKMIKVRHAIIDLYATLNITAIVLLSAVLGYAFYSHSILVMFVPLNALLLFYVLLLTLIVYAYLTLVMRDIVLIHNHKIIVFRKILSFSFQDSIIDFHDLKGLDLFFTPTTGRYALSMITDKKNIIVFNKLSVEDLRWIRGFLICEILEE